MKIRKGDTVKIISGNDKGKQGKVLAVFPKDESVLIEGINIKKKHVRPKQQGKKGELVRMPAPFPASRVMILCSKCGKFSRAAYNTKEGRKYRNCKKCGAEI